MSWGRLDDNFHDHPKVDECSLPAIGLWTLTWSWANKHRRAATTPGLVPTARVRKVAGKDATKLGAELVAAGLWHEVPDGFQIHDFTDYIPKERDPEERKAAGKKGAAKRWEANGKLPSDDHNAGSKDVANGMATDSSCASAPASPSRTQPTTTSTDVEVGAERPQVDIGAVIGEAVGAYVTACSEKPTQTLRNRLGKSARESLAAGVSPELVIEAARQCGLSGWVDVGVQVQRITATGTPKQSTTDQRTTAAQSLKQSPAVLALTGGNP